MLTFALLAGPSVGSAAPGIGSIEAVVTDASDGTSLIGAAVVIEGTALGGVTGLDGTLLMGGVPAGRSYVVANLVGYRPERKRIDVMVGRTTRVEFALAATVIESSPMVVTASRRLQELRRSPTAMNVVDDDEITGRNVSTTHTALKYVPGATSIGSQLSIRGSSGFTQGAGSRVSVLLDGVPILSGDVGDVKWGMIPPEVIGRIEVAKGAGSALYGSGALGGVVNQITRRPTEEPETRLRVVGGVDSRPNGYAPPPGRRPLLYTVSATHTRRVGQTGILASFRQHHSDGSRAGSDGNRYSAFLKVDTPAGESNEISLTTFWSHEDNGQTLQSYPDSLHYTRAGANRVVGPDQFAAVTFHRIPSAQWSWRASAHVFRTAFDERSPDDEIVSSSDAVTWGADGQGTWVPTRQIAAVGGVSVLGSQVDAKLFTGESITNVGVYAQAEIRPTEAISIIAGTRYDRWSSDASDAGGQLSPRIGLVYAPVRATSLRGMVSKGYRGPTISELSTYRDEGDLAIRPNFDLLPERSWTGEIGVSQTLGGILALDMTVFESRYRDMIEPTIQDEADPASGKLVVKFSNVVKARIRGLESAARCALWRDRLRLRASYMLLATLNQGQPDPRAVGPDSLRLPYRPRHSLGLGAELHLGPHFIGYDYRYVGTYPVTVYPYDPRVPLKVSDVRLGTEWQHVRATLSITNVFNYVYTARERQLSGPRHFSLALNASL